VDLWAIRYIIMARAVWLGYNIWGVRRFLLGFAAAALVQQQQQQFGFCVLGRPAGVHMGPVRKTWGASLLLVPR
jgi:hypothetical protein